MNNYPEEMSSARLQDTKSIHKNQLYFHTLAMNSLKMKLRNNSIYNSKEN